MKNFRYFFIFVLFASQVFAAQIWKFSTLGPIEAKPVFFGDKIVIASHDGNIYYLDKETGNLITKITVGEKINSLKMGNELIIAASNNKIFILGKQGNLIRTINETMIYGFEAEDYLYISSNAGLRAYDYNGSAMWTTAESGKAITEPLLSKDDIIFGFDNALIIVNLSGNKTAKINVAPFWGSKPAFYENKVFIGSTENKMYAIDRYENRILWTFDTNGWIMSNPIYYDNNLYFGSNDGNIYALNANNGALVWKIQLSEAVQGNFEIFQLAEKTMILFGSNDNHVYAADAKNGDIILKYSAHNWVHNPVVFNANRLFFGSYDGSFYAYTLDRGCSIDDPLLGNSVGYKPINISGLVFSKNSQPQIDLRISDSAKNGTWIPALTFGYKWIFELDPNEYAFGPLLVECRVSDSEGKETENFPYTMLYRNENEEKRKLRISAIPKIIEGKPFSFNVYDENNALLKNFTISFLNKTFNGDGNINLTIRGSGTYDLFIRKAGFEDQKLSINVEPDFAHIGTIIFTIFGVIAAAFYLFVYKRKR
ncbi:MAG: PQQ-binding-like beta-propeller repeat protein [Candidatus Micrarchaeota archaeon]